LPGIAVSSLGDGMGTVAVAWLALQLVPGPAQALWVAAAVAAYSLPGAVGALALSRLLARRAGARLAGWNATLRAGALGAAAVASAAGALTPAGYVALLAMSSLLGVWGSAGTLTMIAQTLPDEHRLAGNALFSMLAMTGFIAGPALAGLLVIASGPALVIGIDAITFAVLAASYLLAVPRTRPSGRASARASGRGRASGPECAAANGHDGSVPESRPAGFRVIGASRQLLGLTVVTFVFFLLYGPVEVALPIHVHHDLHGSAAVLGSFWTLFATGEVLGGLVTAYLRRWKLWPTVTGIILGWGACLLTTGASGSIGLALAGFGVGGLIYAPFPAAKSSLVQRISPPRDLTAVLAAQGAITLCAPSIGEILGGPLVTAIGARHTLLFSAAVTLALGLATGTGATANAVRRRKVPIRSQA